MAEPTASVPDPFSMWRTWLGQSEQQWNAMLNQAMGTDAYSQSLGRFMELYATLQKNLAETMGRSLGALNMPTRADVLALGERLGRIEDRLAEIERMLARSGNVASAVGDGATATHRPPRTKQPPSHAGPEVAADRSSGA